MYYGYTIRGGPGDLEPGAGGGAGRRAPGSVRRAAAHRSLLTDLNRDHGLVGRHPLRDQTARRAGVAEGDAVEAALLAQQLVEILGAGRRRVAVVLGAFRHHPLGALLERLAGRAPRVPAVGLPDHGGRPLGDADLIVAGCSPRLSLRT